MSGNRTTGEKNFRTLLDEGPNGEKKLRLQFQVDGFKAEEIKIRVEGKNLTVKGEKQVEADKLCETTSFDHEISLPDYLDARTIRSTMEHDGTLVVELSVINELFRDDKQFVIPSTYRQSSKTETKRRYSSRSKSVKQTGDGLSNPSLTTGEPILYNKSLQQEPKIKTYDDSAPAVVDYKRMQSVAMKHAPSSSAKVDDLASPSPGHAARPMEKLVEYKFDLSGFSANDIKIQVVDKTLFVVATKADHVDRRDHQSFSKEVILPEDVIVSRTRSALRSDGQLTVTISIDDKGNTGFSKYALASGDLEVKPFHQDAVGPRVAKREVSQSQELELRYNLSEYVYSNVKIDVSGNILTVSAPRIPDTGRSDFSEKYPLPESADVSHIKAVVTSDGILNVYIPRIR